ncbi:hypothetical protein [Streptomyces sp. NPDC088254]|uniref:hypothetical protein n=1 Tax=Streptomyces sp. NPDC088254 TaxID=3365847 RepID=UPI003816CB4C
MAGSSSPAAGLGPGVPPWTVFVKRVRELASDPQWFQYEELAAVIDYTDGTNAA